MKKESRIAHFPFSFFSSVMGLTGFTIALQKAEALHVIPVTASSPVLFFSIGAFFWLVLLILVFYRAIFHAPLTDKLLPTLFILTAPPSVGYISLSRLSNALDDQSKVLYYIGLFLFLLLVFQIRMFTKIKYYLSWWAYSFPIASLVIASYLMYHRSSIAAFLYIGNVLLVVLTAVIGILLVRTAAAVVTKEICIPEE